MTGWPCIPHKMLVPPAAHMGENPKQAEVALRPSISGRAARPFRSFLFPVFFALLLLSPMLQAAESEFAWNEKQLATTITHFQAPNAANNYAARDWFRISMLAILICLFANALIFVFAKAMHSTTAQRFATGEFYQVSASAVMILVVVVLLSQAFTFIKDWGILSTDTTSACYGAQMDVWKLGPPALIQCKIQEKIEYAEGLFYQAKAVNKDVETLTTLCLYVMSVQAYCGDWDSALHAQMESAHLLANRLTPLAIGLHATYSFVGYLARNMLEVFLPLGILLRIFPGIRGIGGLLIAIAIGFYFVFPIAYLLMDPTTTRPDPADMLPSISKAPSPCFNTFSGAVSMITQLASTKKQTVATPDVSELGQELAKLQTEVFIIPLAALAVTLLFIQTLAPLLGGEAGEIMHFITKVI